MAVFFATRLKALRKGGGKKKKTLNKGASQASSGLWTKNKDSSLSGSCRGKKGEGTVEKKLHWGGERKKQKRPNKRQEETTHQTCVVGGNQQG